MREIKGREEVKELVTTFYSSIKKDKLLGPIFLSMLTTEESWDTHLDTLTDFWETNLFQVIKFHGNPMEAHQRTDKQTGFEITQDHFYQWLMLWNKTVDELFEGDKARLAKEKARRMSTHLYVNIWKHKPKSTE